MILYTVCWGLVFLSLLFLKKEQSEWLLLILGLLLGALILKNSYIIAPSHISKFIPYKSKTVWLKGIVDSYPKVSNRYSSFVLAVEELIGERKVYRVTGKVLVKLFCKEDISYGQKLLLKGKLFRPFRGSNRRISYRDYLKTQKIYSIFIVRYNTPIKHLGLGEVNPLRALVYRIRDTGRDIYFKYLSGAQAGMFSALILGDRNMVGANLGRLFVQTGTIHILAISGLHVGIVAFILELFLKVLRLKRHLRYLAIIFLLILYCLLTGGRPSVVRATIMTIILLIGFLLRRQTKITHSLGLAALIILIVNPQQMFNIGFQLSFVSVISIVYLSPVIRKLFDADYHGYSARITADKSADIRKRNPRISAIKRFFTSALSVSLSAWLGVLPFIAYYFKIISPITVLANLVVVPYIGLVIALGFSLLFVGIIFPILTPIFAAPANLSMVILLQIIKLFNQIPGAYFYL